MPVSRDPEKRARQLANLRPAPAAPAGHSRSLVHGGWAEVLFRDVSDEVRELLDVLGELAPESTNASLDFSRRRGRAPTVPPGVLSDSLYAKRKPRGSAEPWPGPHPRVDTSGRLIS
jgi:hypothetical protein